MSTLVLPAMPGIAYPVNRSPVFDTTVQASISGKETRIARQTYPRWKWSLTYNILRSAAALAEYQAIVGFFNSRQGMFDTFLYQDTDDNFVSGQQIGIGDGTTRTFQLVRSFGGFIEPVLAPNTTAGVAVYLNGTITAAYTLSLWAGGAPGVVTFTTAPASGVVITANINYYWPCRFDMDSADFSLFMSGFYELKKLSIISVKN
jgi:uncharacterized protein (TIGR02217 family)